METHQLRPRTAPVMVSPPSVLVSERPSSPRRPKRCVDSESNICSHTSYCHLSSTHPPPHLISFLHNDLPLFLTTRSASSSSSLNTSLTATLAST
ncbi:hypothetical protein E2C01_020914 [Portunus trituberculatus]|uniref:Uncharacterized protein n=1 Tax=Portunus trituberculatus TaxID=210409 RepID=A0A5B7E2U3_PORTR|nr:hypothetical protein [Portunus trituberculatus]